MTEAKPYASLTVEDDGVAHAEDASLTPRKNMSLRWRF